MHEKILQGVTVGVVAGLIVYWFTSREHADGHKNAYPGDYRPTLGDIRTTGGRGTSACCECCGLVTPETTANPLASDYLCNYPDHAPAISKWNLGVSLQLSCEGIDLHSGITRKETASTFPHGLGGPRSTPPPLRINQTLSCSPNVELPVDCTEVI